MAGGTTEHAPTTLQVVVGRQPIVDSSGEVVAYELLHRSLRDGVRVDGEQMTVEVLMGALSIGIDRLAGDKTMFCNAGVGVLTGEIPVGLPPHRTVIEVLETVVIDDATVEGCRRLVAAGYRLALDDFVWVEGAERLLELATIVKIDVLATSREECLALVERCRPYDVLMLAEKVETPADVAWATRSGFDLFQGFAIERPALVRGRSVGPSLLAQLSLAATVLTEDVDLGSLEEMLRREPGLVVQILQMASVGSHHGLRRQVHTVREALVLLGTRRIREWVALTVLGAQPGGTPDGLATALIRARMVERLAPVRDVAHPEFAFTAGLLSTLDLLLGVDLEELDRTLDLDPGLRTAALRREGPLGALVAEVAAYQLDLLASPPKDRAAAGADPAGDRPIRTPTPVDPTAAQLDQAAAEAFAWTMPYLADLSG